MNISNTDDNKNLISNSLGFYLYELLGVDYSGIYLSTADMRRVAQEAGIDLKLTNNAKMFGELLKIAKDEDRLGETLQFVKKIMEERIETYEELNSRFPGAADAIEEWLIKSKRAVRKIDNAIKEVQNESVS
ncbi:MAG: hypothetical protein JHC37_01340 [Campylobacteraceae bacterium]|jgi:hypothetical protein|nr:hypothetical protein [Campylobacteraceae bacterium]